MQFKLPGCWTLPITSASGKAARTVSASLPQLESARATGGNGAHWLRLFFLPFFLLGTSGFFVLTVRPVLQVLAARHWQETPCVVQSSQLIYEQGDDSTSYRVEVVYHYTSAGQSFTSGRYSFVPAAFPSGYRSKQAIVDRYPSGRETTCFVNPTASSEAVLNRGWLPEMGMGALGLLFALAGGLGLIFAGRIARSGSRTAAPHAGGPLILSPENEPFRPFIRILLGALGWNGFIGFIAYFLFFVEDRADVPLGPRIIIGLFLVAGLFLLIDAFTRFFALFHPRVQITVQNPGVRPGSELTFSYLVTGRATRLQNLRMTLEGHKTANFRGGRKNRPKPFIKTPVFETTSREFLTKGVGRITIPSSDERSHDITWALRVRGRITGCTDLDDDYALPIQSLTE